MDGNDNLPSTSSSIGFSGIQYLNIIMNMDNLEFKKIRRCVHLADAGHLQFYTKCLYITSGIWPSSERKCVP